MVSIIKIWISVLAGAVLVCSDSAWAMHKALMAAKFYRLEMKEATEAPEEGASGRSVLSPAHGSIVQSDLKVHYKALGLKFPDHSGPSRPDVESLKVLKEAAAKPSLKLPTIDVRWPGFDEFDLGFVQIPSGFLPDGLAMGGFESAKYPVTRELWNLIMPDHGVTLGSCATCPVTGVVWDNEDGSPAEVQTFLERLNSRTSDRGCTYDLPTDRELWYLIRGDVSGKNTARYSVAQVRGEFVNLNDENVDEYVTHEGNSAGRPRSVGLKRTNAFGLELGNVLRLSKDPYYTAHPSAGRSARGGCWFFDVRCASSKYKTIAYAGDRQDYIGFSLVRRCKSEN